LPPCRADLPLACGRCLPTRPVFCACT
jgi:hypothetical protein